ncbi:PD-(D/E)XK motif protein [Tardiphaga robiniae]|uniref:PD-(D/E)XK motif protein n=1 Tax=Tardiphaga robiniae TaxID=943830 RepID=A0A161SV88_9BRAD|nr:PD-(D/E)XK motif protein [Tardiphaga robiniae]KZD25692.1 hypothetical protein A4A58_04665 [Tardiphaga robiniae]
MIDPSAELIEKWARVSASEPSGHEWRAVALNAIAPLRILVGVREPDNKIALILEAPLAEAPKEFIHFTANGLTVADQRRFGENIYRVAIVLERSEVRDVFEVLAADIVTVVASASNTKTAIRATTRRLEAWQACLRSGRRGLTLEEQIGLFGEVAVLEMLGDAAGYKEAVAAWGGPLDSIHDFSARGIAFEVKSSTGVGNRIQISTLNQLETEGLNQLLVVRLRLREDSNGITLNEYIGKIRVKIDEPSATDPDFGERLLRLGYLLSDSSLYENNRWVNEGFRFYEVMQGFPRLVNSDIPAGVIDGAYVIDEQALLPFRREIDAFELAAEKMLGKLR